MTTKAPPYAATGLGLQQAVFDRIRQQAGGSRLSARGKEILTGVAAGKSLAVIGGELSLSTAT